MADDSLAAILQLTALMVAQMEQTAAHHSERLDRLDLFIMRQDERLDSLEALMEQQLVINTGVNTTMARIETLLARTIPQRENSRNA